MRVKIEYYYNKQASMENPFWAKSEIPPNGDMVVTCGETWDDAKARHVQKLSDMLTAPEAPCAEEIDI